jgi:endonuclease/exonuclease/phosphatase family metal-dependent hydrolase
MSLPLPRRRVLALALLGLAALLGGCQVGTPPGGPAAPSDGYLFCFWNVENLFDDEPNLKLREPDKHFDRWFAEDKEAREQKYKNLADVLLALNDGRGPDILAVAEVESKRAAEMLAETLNGRLDQALHYKNVVYRNPSGGRHIATAVLTRLKVDGDRTRLLGQRLRILEVHLKAEGHELVVLASHWTSRVSDKTGKGRAKYADAIYGRFRAMVKADPKVDLLVCGDFNDNPDDPSVTDHLHATGDRDKVLSERDPPLLYNLFAGLWAKGEASHFYGRKAYLFDQVCVSPGLLDDAGWSCDPDSARIERPAKMRDGKGRPIRFGTQRTPAHARGASDHFPVTVRLRVAR